MYIIITIYNVVLNASLHTRSRNGHSLIENHQLQGQKYSTWAFHCAKYILYASNNLRKKTLQRDWHADYNYVPFNLICNILYFPGHNYEILPKHYNDHILKKVSNLSRVVTITIVVFLQFLFNTAFSLYN